MKGLFLIGISLLLIGCGNTSQPVSNSNNTAQQPMRSERLQNTTAHTTENQPPVNSNAGGKWSQSGDPIDTTKFDKTIADAEKSLKAAPAEDDAQKAVAQAYFERGFALTQARQYASAIGDYRRALKYDPDHAESKEWIDQIGSIYAMLKKQPPKEGEEPKPLPWKKPVAR